MRDVAPMSHADSKTTGLSIPRRSSGDEARLRRSKVLFEEVYHRQSATQHLQEAAMFLGIASSRHQVEGQSINESVFGETAAGISVKEIRRRDPSFSLPEFRDEVQEVVRPILNAYYKGDVKFLKKYCIPEVIERCSAEHKAYASQNIVVDNKEDAL
ncbi:mitochondrial import inner membrane translocase subunit TIM44-2-like isoform X1 [Apium graveolens]|uniref:mitochondrial import inner membrane translocase subunit TIM44-2-like n=1 Tax=Apium graveolens TaxID=4045 RepID=UPI003D7A26EF